VSSGLACGMEKAEGVNLALWVKMAAEDGFLGK
jgi:hypothetical protein